MQSEGTSAQRRTGMDNPIIIKLIWMLHEAVAQTGNAEVRTCTTPW